MYQTEPQLSKPLINQLCTAISGLSTQEEVLAFLRDALTLEEIEEISRRLEVARLVSAGKTYRSIAAETSVSTATITRIAYWLHHGPGGYRRALEKASLA